MNVEATMEKHGFRLSASCSGKAAFTKFMTHKGKRAYISVTSMGAEGFPTSLEEPVRVVIYEMKSGDELDPAQDYASLGAYLETILE